MYIVYVCICNSICICFFLDAAVFRHDLGVSKSSFDEFQPSMRTSSIRSWKLNTTSMLSTRPAPGPNWVCSFVASASCIRVIS